MNNKIKLKLLPSISYKVQYDLTIRHIYVHFNCKIMLHIISILYV